MRRKLFTLAAGVSAVLFVGIGCCSCCSMPTVAQAQRWVTEEIPVGSSEAEVQSFCRRHQFNYIPWSTTEGQAVRSAKGCELVSPDLLVYVKFDDAGRVKSTELGATTLLP